MKRNLSDANKITLNMLQDTLQIHASKPDFLRMMFPATLQQYDKGKLLDFLFSAEKDYQKKRSVFLNGNITKYPDGTYSRAYQAELSVITDWLNHSGCPEIMEQHIEQCLPEKASAVLHQVMTTDHDKYPRPFQQCLQAMDVQKRSARLLTYLVLWSVFGERIMMLSCLYHSDKPVIAAEETYPSPFQFLLENFSASHQIIGVDFAFHVGSEWLTTDNQLRLLSALNDKQIPCRIIINSEDGIGYMLSHMRNEDKYYVSLSQNIEIWHQHQQKYPEVFTVKVAPMPLLHNFCHSKAAESHKSAMRLCYYTYANVYMDQNYFQIFHPDSPYYQLYANEFEYLWEHSVDIHSFINRQHS